MKTYGSRVRWIGEKKGELEFENGDRVDISSPVDFGGIEGLVMPEELLVASLNACLHMTFVTIAQKMRIGLLSFDCEAEGHLDDEHKDVRFVKCILKPSVSVGSEDDIKRAEKAMSLAEGNCFISNSVNFEIVTEAVFKVGE